MQIDKALQLIYSTPKHVTIPVLLDVENVHFTVVTVKTEKLLSRLATLNLQSRWMGNNVAVHVNKVSDIIFFTFIWKVRALHTLQESSLLRATWRQMWTAAPCCAC